MPVATLLPENIIANYGNAWTDPERISIEDDTFAFFSNGVPNYLVFKLTGTGLPPPTKINSIRVGLRGLYVNTRGAGSITGELNVKIMNLGTSIVYYSEDIHFDESPEDYLQTLRTTNGIGGNWDVESVDDITLKLEVMIAAMSLGAYPVYLDQVYLTVNYEYIVSPLKLTSGVVKLTSGKIII